MEASGTQQFPFRTLSMLVSIISILFFSFLARWLFLRHILPPYLDFFRCFRDTAQPRLGDQAMGEVNAAYLPDGGKYRKTESSAM